MTLEPPSVRRVFEGRFDDIDTGGCALERDQEYEQAGRVATRSA